MNIIFFNEDLPAMVSVYLSKTPHFPPRYLLLTKIGIIGETTDNEVDFIQHGPEIVEIEI